MVEELGASIARSTYTRGARSTHGLASATEVRVAPKPRSANRPESRWKMVEAAGIEPASETDSQSITT